MSQFMDSKVNVIILFDGVWEKRCQTWVYKTGTTRVLGIKKNITYLQLLDILYDDLAVDRLLFELKLEVPYRCGSFALAPALMSSDDDVTLFMDEISMSIQQRIPLCVTHVQKNIIVDTSPCVSINKVVGSEDSFRTQCAKVVPTTTEPKNDSSDEYDPYANDHVYLNVDIEEYVANEEVRTSKPYVLPPAHPRLQTLRPSSSRPIESQDHTKLRALAFTAEDIEAFDRRNTFFSCGNGGEIYIGKMFESKLDLKTKAHAFAMKNNFQFMVKQSGTDRWYIKCKDPNCLWRLRGKKLVQSEMFEITAYNNEHTCSPEVQHSTISPKKKLGRSKIKRLSFEGEHIVVQRKCSRCGGCGHNRTSCKVRN